MQMQIGNSQGPAANAAAAASSSSAPQTLDEIMEYALNYSDMLKAFMHANVGLVWPALNGAMLRLKTSADDRPSVVLALFLQVVANVIGAEYTLMDGRLPKFLPSDLPGNLKLMLKGLLREMSQPYRKIQLNFDASGWNSLQGGVLFLQQQLLSMDSSTTGVLEVTYEEAWQGLDFIVEAVGKTKAYADFVRMLVVNKTADIIRFAESWPGVHKGVELSPKARAHLLGQVTELVAPKVAATW
jgi:hypothetical protein